MNSRNDGNIDDETIRKAGLRISMKPINAQIAPDSRIFEYPHLEMYLLWKATFTVTGCLKIPASLYLESMG